MSESIHRQRMTNCYPPAINNIYEFKAILDSEHPEFDEISTERITEDAYLLTMGEHRIAQWENMFSIVPTPGSTLEQRRDTIIARIRGQGKLNTELINRIVNAFTGGTAKSWIEDSVLNISVLPAEGTKVYIFDNIIEELSQKIPAHLDINIFRAYRYWQDVLGGKLGSKLEEDAFDDFYLSGFTNSWGDIYRDHATWYDVLYGNTRELNKLDETMFDEFILG